MKKLLLRSLGVKPLPKFEALYKMICPPFPDTYQAVKGLNISEPTLRKFSEMFTYSEIIKIQKELDEQS